MRLNSFQAPFQKLSGLSTAEVGGMYLLYTWNLWQATEYTTYACAIRSRDAMNAYNSSQISLFFQIPLHGLSFWWKLQIINLNLI